MKLPTSDCIRFLMNFILKFREIWIKKVNIRGTAQNKHKNPYTRIQVNKDKKQQISATISSCKFGSWLI